MSNALALSGEWARCEIASASEMNLSIEKKAERGIVFRVSVSTNRKLN